MAVRSRQDRFEAIVTIYNEEVRLRGYRDCSCWRKAAKVLIVGFG